MPISLHVLQSVALRSVILQNPRPMSAVLWCPFQRILQTVSSSLYHSVNYKKATSICQPHPLRTDRDPGTLMRIHKHLVLYLLLSNSIRISLHQEAHSHSSNNLVIQFHSYLVVGQVSMELRLLPHPLTCRLSRFHYFLPNSSKTNFNHCPLSHQAKLRLLLARRCHTLLLLPLVDQDRGGLYYQLRPLT